MKDGLGWETFVGSPVLTAVDSTAFTIQCVPKVVDGSEQCGSSQASKTPCECPDDVPAAAAFGVINMIKENADKEENKANLARPCNDALHDACALLRPPPWPRMRRGRTVCGMG